MALPAVAAAQSAGDNQYQDPLGGGSNGGGSDGGGSNGGGSGGGNSGGGSDAPGSSGSAGENASGAADDGASARGTGRLPRTGVPAGVLALSGGALLGAGVALRRRVAARGER